MPRLADIYKAAYELWIIFRGDLERNARSEQLEDKIMRKITDESYHLDHYMAEAPWFFSSQAIRVWNLSRLYVMRRSMSGLTPASDAK